MSWPICPATLHWAGEIFVCELPKGHGMDGEEMHHDPKVGKWLLTVDGKPIEQADLTKMVVL